MSFIDEPQDDAAYKDASRAQSDAAQPDVPVWVVANAGSGKTKVLIDRVARLLLQRGDRPGADPDSILCITYTKAAANEMLDRVFERLGGWSVLEDGELCTKLANLEGRAPDSYEDLELNAARRLFARALEIPGGLRIETIHAFCARLLRRFPLEANVYPGFTEIEEADAAALWHEARRDAILRASETIPAALDVLALAGGHDGAAGALDTLHAKRTAVMAYAARYGGDLQSVEANLREALNAPEASPDALIELAMGEALPVADIRAAIALLAEGGGKSELAAADKLSAMLAAEAPRDRLAAYAAFFLTTTGGPRASNPYNKKTGEASPLLPDLFQMKGGQGRETARMLNLFEQLTAAEAAERSMALLHVGVPALQAYQAAKDRRAALDFDDLIEKTRALLTTKETTEWVLYKLDGGLSHVLLDEAQDTSPAQWDLVKALTGEFFAGKGSDRIDDPRTLFVVGDDKQSIYSFQGADPDYYVAQGQWFESRATSAFGKAVKPKMAMSFRSSPEILGFVDKVWNDSVATLSAEATEAEPPAAATTTHTARRAGQPGRVEVWPIRPRPEEEDPDAWERPLNVLGEDNPRARLASDVADAIHTMIETGETVWREQKDRSWERSPCTPADFLILVRGRKGGLFDSLITALKRRDLPVAGADRLVLADHIGVQDCLNLMRFALLPADDMTLAEILRGPFCGLVDDDNHLFELAHGRGDQTLWGRLNANEDPEFVEAKAFLSSLIKRRTLPPYEFLMAVLGQAGPSGETGWEQLNVRLGSPAHDPVQALLARALAHDSAAPSSLQSFVARMEGDDSEIKRDLAAANGSVRVMTVHGAKGLQSPVVILPDMTSAPKSGSGKIFESDNALIYVPSKDSDVPLTEAARAEQKAKSLRENQRLLYVALTRAQDRLIIGGAWHGRAEGSGYASGSWYESCLKAINTFDPLGENEPSRLQAFGQVPPVKALEEADKRQAILPDWALRAPPESASPKPVQLAPSRLTGADVQVQAPYGETRKKALKRGTLIHALLQYLPELPEDKREEAGRAYLARDPDISDIAGEMLNSALRVINDPVFAHVFAPGGRPEAAIIGTAPELPENAVINGIVDRLVVTETDVLIVDFKTDQPAPDSAEAVAPRYLAQMGAYVSVLRQAYKNHTVRAAIVWTDGPKLMPLSETAMLEALHSGVSGV